LKLVVLLFVLYCFCSWLCVAASRQLPCLAIRPTLQQVNAGGSCHHQPYSTAETFGLSPVDGSGSCLEAAARSRKTIPLVERKQMALEAAFHFITFKHVVHLSHLNKFFLRASGLAPFALSHHRTENQGEEDTKHCSFIWLRMVLFYFILLLFLATSSSFWAAP
jgi:hypothetical protein